VCQFLWSPLTIHYEAVKQILRYGKYNVSMGIRIQFIPFIRVNIYTYADWTGAPMIVGLLEALLFSMVPTLCLGALASNPTVSRSSTEEEYKALANDIAKAMWIQSVSKELVSISLARQFYGAKISGLHTCQLIRCFMLVPNILKLIFILFARKLP
jgi:histone deacetylase 1/2